MPEQPDQEPMKPRRGRRYRKATRYLHHRSEGLTRRRNDSAPYLKEEHVSTKAEILHEVHREMVLAERKHGDQMDVPLGCSKQFSAQAEMAKEMCRRNFARGQGTWLDIAYEEVMETFAEEDLDKIRAEALQAAAMFAQIARVCDYQMEKAVEKVRDAFKPVAGEERFA